MPIAIEKSTTKPILWIGFFVGAVASWGLLSGNQHGQVNILFLLLVYVALPIFSIVISSSSLLMGGGLNLAKLTSVLPIWSNKIQMAFLRQKQAPMSKLSFFYQSQLAALSFSAASILVLIILLLTTDVNFIWRSTILTADDIYPALSTLAWPWQFWPSAQPNFELLVATQDSRLTQGSLTNQLGHWWQFVLATQIVYAFGLRGIAIIICQILFYRKQTQQPDIQLVTERKSANRVNQDQQLADLITDTQSDFATTNWGGVESNDLNRIVSQLSHQPIAELKAGPLASYPEQLVAERWQEPQLLVVKGWEPPLGELLDYMQNGRGYLLPLDWSRGQLQPLSAHHLNEWRRFANSINHWQVLQPEG